MLTVKAGREGSKNRLPQILNLKPLILAHGTREGIACYVAGCADACPEHKLAELCGLQGQQSSQRLASSLYGLRRTVEPSVLGVAIVLRVRREWVVQGRA